MSPLHRSPTPSHLPQLSLLLALLAQPVLAADNSQNPYYLEALQFYDSMEYEAALLRLEKATLWPTNSSADHCSIALLEGLLALELQQPERGKSAFRRALILDPQAKLGWPVSPKIASVLEEVRAESHAIAAIASAQIPAPSHPLQTLTQANSGVEEDFSQIAASDAILSSFKIPGAIGGGIIALGGMLSWAKAKSLEGQVGNADPSITTRAHLEDTVHRGRTFERLGWILMGVGVATTSGSILFLDRTSPVPRLHMTAARGGATLSAEWHLP